MTSRFTGGFSRGMPTATILTSLCALWPVRVPLHTRNNPYVLLRTHTNPAGAGQVPMPVGYSAAQTRRFMVGLHYCALHAVQVQAEDATELAMFLAECSLSPFVTQRGVFAAERVASDGNALHRVACDALHIASRCTTLQRDAPVSPTAAPAGVRYVSQLSRYTVSVNR